MHARGGRVPRGAGGGELTGEAITHLALHVSPNVEDNGVLIGGRVAPVGRSSSRRFIFNVAVEKAGAAMTNQPPLEFLDGIGNRRVIAQAPTGKDPSFRNWVADLRTIGAALRGA